MNDTTTETLSKKYVVFKLMNEEYGIDIQKVMTIEKLLPIARIPKTPEFVKGVINLRGEIISSIDLRIKFGFPKVDYNDETRIVVVKIDDVSVGMIVDEVDEVVQFEETMMENVSNINSSISLDFICGIGKINGRIITLLDHDKMITEIEN